jgi:NAD(P)-dependent dehydrogenase (short-subunit alcohol dehydrogenase family)
MGRGPQLAGQTLLVIGGSSGIGLETARRAHGEGAKVIVVARDPLRVQRAGLELGGSIAAFDATDFHRLSRFFQELRTPLDHVVVTAPGHHDVSRADFDVDEARREVEGHLLLPLQVAREAADRVRPGGTLLFTGCSDGRHCTARPAFLSAITAALAVMTKNFASELAPIRVNMIAPGFVAMTESAALLGDCSSDQRAQLRTTLPVERLVGPAEVAALAVHIMTNTAVTGATLDIDGRQPVVEA